MNDDDDDDDEDDDDDDDNGDYDDDDGDDEDLKPSMAVMMTMTARISMKTMMVIIVFEACKRPAKAAQSPTKSGVSGVELFFCCVIWFYFYFSVVVFILGRRPKGRNALTPPSLVLAIPDMPTTWHYAVATWHNGRVHLMFGR